MVLDESNIGGREGFGSDRLRAEVFHQLPILPILFLGPERVGAVTNQAVVDFYDGYNPIGTALRDALVGVEDQGMMEMYDRAFAGETVRYDRTRWVLVTPEGHEQEVWLNHLAMPFRDLDGEIVGAIAMAVDITEQVRRDEEQAAAARELSRRYQRATDVIAEVQRSLLPAKLPVLPSVEVTASYVVGGSEQAAGGDWFDAIPFSDGSVVAVVGDVVGHGVDASAVMAQLRAVTLERLNAGASVAEAVAALDRFVEVVPSARGTTICVLRLDVSSGEFEFCSAGHPPPLILDPTSGGQYAAPSGQGPLGENEMRRTIAGRLDAGHVLLLYTDGIIERPGVAATAGTVELLHVAELAVADRLLPAFSSPSAVDRVTGQVVERLTRETGSQDDITMLAVQRVQSLSPLHHRAVIGLADVDGVRTAFRSWFRLEQIEPEALFELDQIVTELCENSIRHGYEGQPGEVTIEADLAATGVLTLTVSDHGTWRPRADHDYEGVGLAIVGGLAESVTIDREDGTRVTVEYRPWKLSHSAPARAAKTSGGVADIYLQRVEDAATLVLSGPIDAAVVDELEIHLALCTAPGAPDFTLDLSEVTMLSSQAIRIIRRSLSHAERTGITATARCRPGSVAQQVLALAAIPTSAPSQDAHD